MRLCLSFLQVASDRTRADCLELQQARFRLGIRENAFTRSGVGQAAQGRGEIIIIPGAVQKLWMRHLGTRFSGEPHSSA